MNTVSVLSAVIFGGVVTWIALTIWDRRVQQRLHSAQQEAERRWPMLAVEDFAEEDELAPVPFVSGAPIPPPVRVHSECFNAWADGKRPCGRCELILAVRLKDGAG